METGNLGPLELGIITGVLCCCCTIGLAAIGGAIYFFTRKPNNPSAS